MQVGKVIGGVLFVGAAAAIWLWPHEQPTAERPEVVRPVRSAVVASGHRMPDLHFAGIVKANESRTLAFKQSGRIERIPVSKGQRVKKGERLAWLVQDDFVHDLEKATAAAERDRLSSARKAEAAKRNAISKEELSQAEAQLRQSEASLSLARKALEEATLVAPFDVVVADIPASELAMVGTMDPVVVIQDLDRIKIDVQMPEAYVIAARRIRYTQTNCVVRISFDSLPGVSFPATFVEYTAKADAKTQTFCATYVMDAPEGVLLLPGMSATLTVPGDSYEWSAVGSPDELLVASSAVGVDAAGGYFVWVLEKTDSAGVFAVRRRPVKVGVRRGEFIGVAEGLKAGERIATAGVAVLSEGSRVTLLEKADEPR